MERARAAATASPAPATTACPAESACQIDIWAVFACTQLAGGEGRGVDFTVVKWALPYRVIIIGWSAREFMGCPLANCTRT